MIFLYLFIFFAIGCFVLFLYEIKNAKEIDSREPFLNGDYDPAKDPTKLGNKND